MCVANNTSILGTAGTDWNSVGFFVCVCMRESHYYAHLDIIRQCCSYFKTLYSIWRIFIASVTVDILKQDRKHLVLCAQCFCPYKIATWAPHWWLGLSLVTIIHWHMKQWQDKQCHSNTSCWVQHLVCH